MHEVRPSIIDSMNKSDKNLLKRSAYALADSTASSIPGLAQAWALSKALYGNALELRQQRALEWVEAIQNDQSVFNESVVKSEEFQDGFIVGLEDYIKLRSFIKRRAALKIFREFTAVESKVDFQLERFNDVLAKISHTSLNNLAMLKRTTDTMDFQDVGGELVASLQELEYLGLVRQGSEIDSSVWSATDSFKWRLTSFAHEFVEFVEEDAQLEDNSLMS